jgi:cytochrome c biogenesis protein CcdA
MFGAMVNVIGLPFAVPYFAAIDQFLKADLDTADVLTALLLYNLAYALPFLVIPVMTAIMGDKSRPMLERANAILERGSAFLMCLLLGLIGLALLADGASYFVTVVR